MNVKNLYGLGAAAYGQLVKTGNSAQSSLLLAVRLYWGWQFAQTGWGKLQHIPKVAEFFASLGIPAPALNAVTVSWMEFLGGMLLMLGLGSRLVGLMLGFDMLIAYLTASRMALLSIFSDPGKFYGDDAYTFLFASVLILIFGPGDFSVDALTGHRFHTPVTRGGSRTVAVQHT